MSTAPTTAADARALADQLAAKESALAEAQMAARREAEFQAWQSSLDETSALTGTVEGAQAIWDAAAADPNVGLGELFSIWQNLRTASATRARLVSEASAGMTVVHPLRNPTSGQPQGHRADVFDSLVLVQFVPAVEGALAARIVAAANGSAARVRTRVTKAGEQAASKATITTPM